MSQTVKQGKALLKAKAAWGDMPYWIEVLAHDCDRVSQRKTADFLEVCPAMVSLAINNKREDLEHIKERVEKLLMVTRVQCPVLGLIDFERCHAEQAKPLSASNTLRIMLFSACKTCVHKKSPQKEDKKEEKKQ